MGYAVSQQRRKRIEEAFGWLKTVALLRKTRLRGVARVAWMFTFAAAAYNLVRMRNLLAPANLNGVENPARELPSDILQSLKSRGRDSSKQTDSRSCGIFPHPIKAPHPAAVFRLPVLLLKRARYPIAY